MVTISKDGVRMNLQITPFGWLAVSLTEDETKYQMYESTITTDEAVADFMYRVEHNLVSGELVGK